MAVPKRRITSTRRDKRRSHDRLKVSKAILCSHCKQPKVPHRVCPSCGYYGGIEVMEVEE